MQSSCKRKAVHLCCLICFGLSQKSELAEKIDRFYEEHLFLHEFKQPSYRKIIIHYLTATDPLTLSMVETSREEESTAELEFHRLAMTGILELIQNNKPEPPQPAPEPAPAAAEEQENRHRAGACRT